MGFMNAIRPIVKTNRLLTTRQVAKLTGESPNQLRAWRHEGEGNGPRWVLLGEKKTMYWESTVKAWIKKRDSQSVIVGW